MSGLLKRSGLEKVFLIFLLLVMMVVPVRYSEAGNPIAATEITQLANNVELIAILGEEAKQLLQLIETYQLMLEEAKKLPDVIKRNAVNALMNLARSTELGMAIGYASSIELDQAFAKVDGYREWLKIATTDQKAAWAQQVIQTTYDTVQGALNSAGLQQGMFSDESTAVDRMMSQMQTAKGQNQILQAGFSIASAQVEQMQKLRQLVMGQSNMIGAGISAEMDERSKEEAGWQKFVTPHREIDGFSGRRLTPRERFNRMVNPDSQ